MNVVVKAQGMVQYTPQKALQQKETDKKLVKNNAQQKKQLQEKVAQQQKKKKPFLQTGLEKSDKKESLFPKIDDTPGQLAVKLANAKTPLDIQEIISKTMMKLISLKMLHSSAEGKEKIKLSLQIKRMEKVLSRSRNKIRQLRKEDDLERQQRAAKKSENTTEVHEIYRELKQRRSKRKNEESRYAQKELAKDAKEAQDSLSFEKSLPIMDFSNMPIIKERTVDISTSINISV